MYFINMHILQLLRLSMQLAMLLMLFTSTVYILLAVSFTKDRHYYDESKYAP